jgi:hypothetical protein
LNSPSKALNYFGINTKQYESINEKYRITTNARIKILKSKKTLRLRGFTRKLLNIEKNSKILRFLYKNIAEQID